MAKKKFNWWIAMVFTILAGTAGWAFYNLINMGAEDVLTYFDITNPYAQAGIVFGSILLIFIIAGVKLKHSLERIL